MNSKDDQARRRELAATRQRRSRLRKKCGLVPVTVELEQDAIEELHANGLLASRDLADKNQLSETLGYLFSELLCHAVTPNPTPMLSCKKAKKDN